MKCPKCGRNAYIEQEEINGIQVSFCTNRDCKKDAKQRLVKLLSKFDENYLSFGNHFGIEYEDGIFLLQGNDEEVKCSLNTVESILKDLEEESK